MIHLNSIRGCLDQHLRPGTGRHNLVFHHEGAAFELDLEKVDELACALHRVQVVPAATPKSELADRSHAIAERVTGLMEPLRVVEVDTPLGVAQLRSQAPATADADARAYYELLLEASGRATLRRFRAQADSTHREPIPFTLTREALAKLLCDLCVIEAERKHVNLIDLVMMAELSKDFAY